MSRVWQALAWAGVVWCVFFAWWASWMRGSLSWIPFAGGAVLCLGYLVFARRRQRQMDRSLPRALRRLAYRSDETYVAFCWLWRDGPGRMRILRSDERSAAAADDAAGQVCVYDGEDDRFVDAGVEPHRTYHYSLFAGDAAGGWAEPVLQLVMTFSRTDRTSLQPKVAVVPPGAGTGGGGRVGYHVWTPRLLVADAIADGVAGAATDLIFAAASVFAADKAADGWEEIT